MTSDSAAIPRRVPSGLKNILSNWAGFVCASLIAFFLSPFVLHRLGDTAYGVWILVGSLTGYLGLLNLGVRAAVTRYVARFHAEANHSEAGAIASTALAIFLIAGAFAVLLSLMVAGFVLPVFHIPPAYSPAARIIVILAGLNIGVSLVGGVFGGIVAALHRFDLINLTDVATSALSAVAIVLALKNGGGLLSLAAINLFFAVAGFLAYATIAFRLYPSLRIRFAECDRRRLKLISSFGIYAFILQLSYNLIFYTDSIVIGVFLPVSFIAFFSVAGNLINSARSLVGGISTTMTPRASSVEAVGGQRAVGQLLVRATGLATLVVLPIAVTFWIRGSSFIRLWMGPQYAEPSGRVLSILTLALVFVAANQVVTATILGIGKQKWLVVAACAEGLLNLILSAALVRRMGIDGVAWGTTAPSLLVSLAFLPWFVRRSFDIPVRRYLVSTWLRPAIAVAPFAVFTYGIEKLWPARTLPFFFLQTAVILPAVLVASWHSCLDRSQRQMYARRIMQPALKAMGWV